MAAHTVCKGMCRCCRSSSHPPPTPTHPHAHFPIPMSPMSPHTQTHTPISRSPCPPRPPFPPHPPPHPHTHFPTPPDPHVPRVPIVWVPCAIGHSPPPLAPPPPPPAYSTPIVLRSAACDLCLSFVGLLVYPVSQGEAAFSTPSRMSGVGIGGPGAGAGAGAGGRPPRASISTESCDSSAAMCPLSPSAVAHAESSSLLSECGTPTGDPMSVALLSTVSIGEFASSAQVGV